MYLRLTLCVAGVALGVVAAGLGPAWAADLKKPDDSRKVAAAAVGPEKARQALDRAVGFLVKDAVKWRAERGCATCHHGTMTVWALSEAKSQGYAVGAEPLADAVQWTKDRFLSRISKPRDPRPGWSLVSVPAIYLGVMSQSLPVLSRDEINQVAVHLARHQEADGTWQLPPPKNGAPPTWESPETLSLWAYLAWEPTAPAEPDEAAKVRAGREKAAEWLAKTKSTDTTQAAALRLLFGIRSGKPATQLVPRIEELLHRQNADGGWSQVKDLPSDAYATGQVLWALSFARLEKDRPQIARAVAFLVATQKEDGSWPMTSRNHPGLTTTRNPIRSPVPITYFGSAWATLGLVRSVSPARDTAAKQQRAFDSIRAYGGKYEVDEKTPGKPVVSVDIPYAVDDAELANLTALLTAFPQLATLRFKSGKITDAGLVNLQALSQLRRLTLENATVTDAGLAQLKGLTYLEELNVKGSKVTEAGAKGFQKGMGRVKVGR